jgi:lipid-A-disaccharide synthase
MKILAIAGELSGDAHGGPLLRELGSRIPGFSAAGIGGAGMLEAGLRPLFPLSALQVHGLVEVVRHLPRLFRILSSLEAWLDRERPDGVLLIDYPGFNLRVAQAAKARGIPVVWYSSPQIWAWRGGRLKTIARVVDKIMVLFPFEAALYRQAGIDAEFVGHPLVGLEPGEPAVRALREHLRLAPGRTVVALMPGSRPSELRRNLPPVLEGIRLIREAGFQAEFVLPAAPTLARGEIDAMVASSGTAVHVVDDAFLPLLKVAQLAIVASGTATLQVGLAGIPFVVVYRVSPLTYWLARGFAYVRHISIVNILAGREVVPELLQGALNPRQVRDTFLALALDPVRQERMRRELAGLAGKLGEPGAYARGAELIARFFLQRASATASA